MDKQNQIEEMSKDLREILRLCAGVKLLDHQVETIAYELSKKYQPKIPENAVVIDKNENPCLSCPVPEYIQRDVDCSTICGAVRLGIDWQNQCKVLVKENKQLTKALAEKGKETAKKFAEMADKKIAQCQGERDGYEAFTIDDKAKYDGDIVSLALFEICKKITEGGEVNDKER